MEKGVDSIDSLVPTLVWSLFIRAGYDMFMRIAYECKTAENGIARLDISRWFFDQAGVPAYRGTRCMFDPAAIDAYVGSDTGKWPVVTNMPKVLSAKKDARAPGFLVLPYVASDENDEKIKRVKKYAIERMGVVFPDDRYR